MLFVHKQNYNKIKPTNYENYFIYSYNKDYYKNKLNIHVSLKRANFYESTLNFLQTVIP
jgi:hypothetical protein